MVRTLLIVACVGGLSAGTSWAQVLDCPPGAGATVQVEQDDDFTGPPVPAQPSAQLSAFITGFWGYPLRGFDEGGIDKGFGHTFVDLPSGICGAVVTLKLHAESFGSSNDTVRFQLVDPNDTEGFLWRKVIANIIGSWDIGQEAVLVLDLANLVPGLNGNTNIVPSLAGGTLDVVIEDDTAVDYITLETCTACPVGVQQKTWGSVKAMYR